MNLPLVILGYLAGAGFTTGVFMTLIKGGDNFFLAFILSIFWPVTLPFAFGVIFTARLQK